MAFMDIHFYSEVLGMQTSVLVVIPEKNTWGQIGISNCADARAYKCLYLLHGLSDDNSIWLRRTSIDRYASEHGICVVMPSADTSFYSDMKYGHKWYTYIAKELPLKIREFLKVSDKREDNYVGGLSMGGYGALKIALREFDRFSAAIGLSSCTDINRAYEQRGLTNIFGDSVPEEDDLFALAQREKDNPLRPRIFIGCGKQDSLYGENLRFRDKLQELNYDLLYRESDGNHNWAFWDEYIQYALDWLLK